MGLTIKDCWGGVNYLSVTSEARSKKTNNDDVAFPWHANSLALPIEKIMS